MQTKRSKYLLALLLLVAFVAAACSGPDDSTEEGSVIVLESSSGTTSGGDEAAQADAEPIDAPPAGTDEEQALAFAACMRDEGIDFPDPAVNADGSVDFFGGGGGRDGGGFRDDPNFQGAIEECGELIEGASFLPNSGDFTEQEDAFFEMAECLRDNGIDVADPDFSGGAGPGRDLFGPDFDPEDPATAAAIDACQDVFANIAAGGGN